MTAAAPDRLSWELPAALEATEPPEDRGLTRDGVRMLVAHRSSGELVHSTFALLPSFLDEGDLVVINTSGTIPAAVAARTTDGTELTLHLSTELDDGRWVVEPRRKTGRTTERWRGPAADHHLLLDAGATCELVEPYGPDGRLWIARLQLGSRTLSWLAVHGTPIRYAYVDRPWPIDRYQNVYATEPGSAEMPSAGRPFTPEVLMRLVAKGVGVAPVVLHTGVASLEEDELPYPERVRIPRSTAARVNATRREGGRVIAVGTTVVRSLETSVSPDGLVLPYEGWTSRVVSPAEPPRVTDGLLTGWHEPASSHLLLLEAIAGRVLLEASYAASLAEGYLWHEFGDVNLVLP